MALLESALMGRVTISYQPGLRVADKCTAVRLGLIPKLDDLSALTRWLTEHWEARQPSTIRRRPAFADREAGARVIEVARGLVRRKGAGFGEARRP